RIGRSPPNGSPPLTRHGSCRNPCPPSEAKSTSHPPATAGSDEPSPPSSSPARRRAAGGNYPRHSSRNLPRPQCSPDRCNADPILLGQLCASLAFGKALSNLVLF